MQQKSAGMNRYAFGARAGAKTIRPCRKGDPADQHQAAFPQGRIIVARTLSP